MPGRNIVGDYRYGYQGQYSEKDDETGLNAFELRMYDSRINRRLTTDPAGQYDSPYLAMGNNPVSRVDPDGGFDWKKDKNGNALYDSNLTAENADFMLGKGETYLGETHFEDNIFYHSNGLINNFNTGELFQAFDHGLSEVVVSNTLSIKVDGRELNPGNYALSNSAFPENIASLYTNLVGIVGNDDFQFKITGGDRYIDNGKVYSSTNNSWIDKAGTGSPHIESNGARAVDLRIKFNDGRLVPRCR